MTEKPTTTLPVKRGERSVRIRDPFDFFEDIQQEMARFWGHTWPPFPRPLMRPLGRLAEFPSAWAPRLDAYERNGELIIKAELPGVDRKDITLSMEDGTVVIQGERKSESEVREEDYHRAERAYGSFHRRLALPFEVKPEEVKASFTDGVLEIHIPKPVQAEKQPHKIPVS